MILRTFFQNLSIDIPDSGYTDTDKFINMNTFRSDDQVFPSVDESITVQEITSAVKCLKRGKAHRTNYILNEYFIEGIDFLSSHIAGVFDAVLKSVYFSEP